LGIKGGYRNNNYGFVNLVSLRPVTSSPPPSTISTTNNAKKIPKTKTKTRTMRISEDLYQKFVNFSERYYNIETYSTILEDLN
jgi:hypothetical protein